MDKLLDFNLPIFKTLSAYMSATLKSDNKNIKLINNIILLIWLGVRQVSFSNLALFTVKQPSEPSYLVWGRVKDIGVRFESSILILFM